MIELAAKPPPINTLKFFDRLLPGIWPQWAAAVESGLVFIDAGASEPTTVTSWYRSPSENKRVGGHPDSQHLVGLAFDVVPGKGATLLAMNEAADTFRQLGFAVEIERAHVHVQTFPAGVLRQVGILDALRL